MAIAALGIELERRWHADRYEPAEEAKRESINQEALVSRAAGEAAPIEPGVTTGTTQQSTEKEPIGQPSQRLSSGGADGVWPAARSGAGEQGRAQHESPTVAALDSSKEPGGAAQGVRMRGTARGGAAAATTETSSATETRGNSNTGVKISGTFLAGPVVSQNTIGIRAYSETGELLATTRVNSEGSYTLTLPEGYAGYVLVEAIDLDPATPDYVDERTREAQNLTTALRTIGYVSGADTTLHVNPITEIAAQKLGLTEGATTFKALGLSQALIDAVEAEVAVALGIPTDFMTGTAPISTINTDGTVVSGVSDAYGITLAAISGAEIDSSTSAVMKAIAAGISSSGLDETANTMLINGATLAANELGEKLLTRLQTGLIKTNYAYSNIFPLTIGGRWDISKSSYKALIGEEKAIGTWPGIGTATLAVSKQAGVIEDIAVSITLKNSAGNDAEGIFVTLIGPAGQRVPVAGTILKENFGIYPYDPSTPGGTTFNLSANHVESFLYSESLEDISKIELSKLSRDTLSKDERIKRPLTRFTPLLGSNPNGKWEIEVTNSSGTPIQLIDWQLHLKTSEDSTLTDENGAYSFNKVSPRSISGPVQTWIESPTNRALLSPAGSILTGTSSIAPTATVSFGLSQAGEGSSNNAGSEGWSRFDVKTLANQKLLHSSFTLNQAVTALSADTARSKYGINGKGVSVGIISNSYNVLKGEAWDINRGLLSKETTVVHEGDSDEDEGRAMAQLIHSIAPGSSLYFSAQPSPKSINSFGQAKDETDSVEKAKLIRSGYQYIEEEQKEFARRIRELATTYGCQVIVDDCGGIEPWFQDGVIAQAIQEVQEEQGVTYFSAAGNALRSSYSATFNPRTKADLEADYFNSLPKALREELNKGFEAHLYQGESGSSLLQEIKFARSGVQALDYQWNSPWGNSTARVKILMFDDKNNLIREGYMDPSGKIPYSYLETEDMGNRETAKLFKVAIVHDDLDKETRPEVVKWVAENLLGPQISKTSNQGFNESTVYGHANAGAGASVGAVPYWVTPAYWADKTTSSTFSSWGQTPIYFDINGNRLPSPILHEAPFLSAPQHGNTSFFSKLEKESVMDIEKDNIPNFTGTSAAAPNAAGVAALLLQYNPDLTPAEIFNALKVSATEIHAGGLVGSPNNYSIANGYGLINALSAVDHIAQLNISGTVYEDVNRDGQKNPGESGLEGIRVFIDSNGNRTYDAGNVWQTFSATAKEENTAEVDPELVLRVDPLTGLLLDSRYENIIHGTDSLSSNTPFSDRSLLISSITSTSDYDRITEGGKNLTLNGDLLLHFDGASRTTAGSYSILKADSISGSFDNILIEGLSDDLYFGIGIEGGDNIQVRVSEDYFVGSTKAASLF